MQCGSGQRAGGDEGFMGPCGSPVGLCMVGCSPKAPVAPVRWWRGWESQGHQKPAVRRGRALLGRVGGALALPQLQDHGTCLTHFAFAR